MTITELRANIQENIETIYDAKVQDYERKQKEREKDFDSNFSEIKEIEINLPFHVLDFNSQIKILIWHKGKILPMLPNQLKPDDLKLFVGDILVPEEIEGGSKSPNPYTKIKDRIISLAHTKGLIDNEEPPKSGIQKIKNEWIIVLGRQAVLIKNKDFNFLETPIIHDKVIHLSVVNELI